MLTVKILIQSHLINQKTGIVDVGLLTRSSSNVINTMNEKNKLIDDRKCQMSWESNNSQNMHLWLSSLDSAAVT